MVGRSIAIVQARMNSTRLPGKVLLDLSGTSVLSHVYERCRVIKGIEDVCFAVPEGASSDPVAEEALRLGASVSRGPEKDVLERYNRAAKELNAETVMRITSDCPIVDPDVCAQVLDLFNEGNCHFATNNAPPSWPHGLDCEVFSAELLERAADRASKPFEREHVTPWMRNNNPEVTVANVPAPKNWYKHRWTLDTPEDYEFICKLFDRMPNGAESFDYKIPLAIVEADPLLCAINIKA